MLKGILTMCIQYSPSCRGSQQQNCQSHWSRLSRYGYRLCWGSCIFPPSVYWVSWGSWFSFQVVPGAEATELGLKALRCHLLFPQLEEQQLIALVKNQSQIMAWPHDGRAGIPAVWWIWHCPQKWPMWIPPGNGHCAGREISEMQLPGRLENHLRQHFEDSLEKQEWWELCMAKILAWGKRRGKDGYKMTWCSCKETQSEASASLCLLHNMTVSSCTSGAGKCHADSRHCCALGVLPTPWSGFGKAADAMSSILSVETGTLPSWAHCTWWDPTIRAHIQLWIGASCKGSPRREVLFFGVGHHVTWFVSFCGFDGFAHISIVLCVAFAVMCWKQSGYIKTGKIFNLRVMRMTLDLAKLFIQLLFF